MVPTFACVNFFRCSSRIKFPFEFSYSSSNTKKTVESFRNIQISRLSTGPNSDPETFSFLCQRQMVKVDSNIHHLNRLKSSLKSGYFEKIFASGDFEPKYDHVLEIQPKNGEVFPIIVELIHGKNLLDVLKNDNYVSLLETMDQLEMEIDLQTVNDFIGHNLTSYSPLDAKIFELYDFIKANSKFEKLLDNVFKYFSSHLMVVRNQEIFPSLLLDHLIQIIKNVEKPNDNDRYEIVQMCTDWLCHDIENRLPHMATLINSIKPRFRSEKNSDESNSALSNRLSKTSMDEQPKTIAKCVFAMLAYGEIFDPRVLDKHHPLRHCDERYYDFYPYEYTDNKYTDNKSRTRTTFTRTIEEKNKLKKFLKNCDLYDITVRAGEKTYKLHRSLLEFKSGYFADIFRAEYAEAVVQDDGIRTYPSKLKEYLLDDKIDQSTFHKVIDYIYFDESIGRELDVNVAVFKTADILKIDDLLETCKNRLENQAEEVDSQNVIEILNFTHGKIKHHDLYTLYLCKHLRDKWPNIDNMSQFCSISFEMLAKIIKSPRFRLDDPYEILDICSKWIYHDVKNRYHLLPQIARTINEFCVINCDKFETENVTDLDNCSQQMIRDKLWELLLTISYMLPTEESSNQSAKKLEEIPMFIASSNNEEVDVLNVDLDSIGSFKFPDSKLFNFGKTSTTMINNCLFLLGADGENTVFQVYNLSSKKCFVSSYDYGPKRRYYNGDHHTVLNCNNEIYCCSRYGLVMKFSMQLNRWMMLSGYERFHGEVLFTSDGKMLYRMYAISKNKDPTITSNLNYVIEEYNFETKLWSRVPGSPLLKTGITGVSQLTVFNGCDLAASTFAEIFLFNHKTKKWRKCEIPSELWYKFYDAFFAHCEDRMFLVINKKIYDFTLSDGSVELRKKLPSKYTSEYLSRQYGKIAFIHRPKFERSDK